MGYHHLFSQPLMLCCHVRRGVKAWVNPNSAWASSCFIAGLLVYRRFSDLHVCSIWFNSGTVISPLKRILSTIFPLRGVKVLTFVLVYFIARHWNWSEVKVCRVVLSVYWIFWEKGTVHDFFMKLHHKSLLQKSVDATFVFSGAFWNLWLILFLVKLHAPNQQELTGTMTKSAARNQVMLTHGLQTLWNVFNILLSSCLDSAVSGNDH